MSLDVLYHLVEDAVFEEYVQTLFAASTQHVIIYSSDTSDNSKDNGPHVKHRAIARWIHQAIPHWNLIEQIPNKYPLNPDTGTGSFADFFVYTKEQD